MSNFDHVVKSDMYKPYNSTLAVYEYMRKIMADKNNKFKKPIITLSPDTSISGSTISGLAEKTSYSVPTNKGFNYESSLKIIYINSLPNMSTKKYTYSRIHRSD